MAWCPICKNEYREGITICAECKVTLVENLDESSLTPVMFGDEAEMTALNEYLQFNAVTGTRIRFDAKENIYELLVPDSFKLKSKKMIAVFQAEKAAEMLPASEESEEGLSKTISLENSSPSLYQSNQEKAQDSRSSAIACIIVGLIGVTTIGLGIMGYLPFAFENSYMFYGVLCTVFILFLVMGCVSLSTAKLFAKKAEAEISLKETLTQWFQNNLIAEEIDLEIQEETLSEEAKYFKRCEIIKNKCNQQFINLDQSFLDHFIDTEIYDMIFSNTSE